MGHSSFLSKLLQHSKSGILSDTEMIHILGGSSDQRYGLVKRAISQGTLLHLRRGLYAISALFRRQPYHLFEIASHLYSPSYISFESALSYHGWIPEAVPIVTSATPRRKSEFDTVLGIFRYLHVPQVDAFSCVSRIEAENNAVFFMASPWKAIVDYVYTFKKNWHGLGPLTHGLRIEPDKWEPPSQIDLASLYKQYKSVRVHHFLDGIQREFSL